MFVAMAHEARWAEEAGGPRGMAVKHETYCWIYRRQYGRERPLLHLCASLAPRGELGAGSLVCLAANPRPSSAAAAAARALL